MPKLRTWILIVAGALAIAAVAWAHRAPDVGAWPRCEYFRCLECGGPASVDPTMPERWGCPACEFATYHLQKSFCAAGKDQFPIMEERVAASVKAGVIAPEDGGPTLLDLYHNSCR